MGITISSKRYSCDMGCGGFMRFRKIVAANVSEIVGEHYENLDEEVFLVDRDEFYKKYNIKTEKLIKQKELTIEVANFLYQSDCSGKIDRKQAKEIYALIKECNDNISIGYIGREDCAKMSDMKKIFSDKTKVEWY